MRIEHVAMYVNDLDTAKDFLRPVAQELKGKDLSLGEGKLTDKIGPELASKLVLYADLIEKLVPLADNTLAKFNELPVFKIKDIEDKIGKYRELAKEFTKRRKNNA